MYQYDICIAASNLRCSSQPISVTNFFPMLIVLTQRLCVVKKYKNDAFIGHWN